MADRGTSAADYQRRFRLDGQALLVVGGGAGMGREACRALAALGAKVVVVDRHLDRAAALADEIGGVAVVGDATDEACIRAAIERAEEAFGRIDGAVDVVGRTTRLLIDELTPERWEEAFHLNLTHAFLLGRLLGPRLAAAGGGSLTFVSSVSARYGAFPTPRLRGREVGAQLVRALARRHVRTRSRAR